MHQPLSINIAIHCPLIRHATIKEKAIEVKDTHKNTLFLFLDNFSTLASVDEHFLDVKF